MEYIKGKQNIVADAASRLPTGGPSEPAGEAAFELPHALPQLSSRVYQLAQVSALRTYDELKEDAPCQICGGVDDQGVLCDECDKAFHKECLGDLYIEKNPVSWFCPECEKSLVANNARDPYYDHDLLRYIATGELDEELP